MSTSALSVMIRTPERDIDTDVEAGVRLLPSTFVEEPAGGALIILSAGCMIRAGVLAGFDGAQAVVQCPSRTLRPVRLLCGDHRLAEADSMRLADRDRETRLVEDLIHTVWRAERMSPMAEPQRTF